MVNDLFRGQTTADQRLHDDAVDHHPASRRSVGMPWVILHDVALSSEATNSLGPDRRTLSPPPVLALDQAKAHGAHGDANTIRPALDLGSATSARGVDHLPPPAWTIAEGVSERNSKQQREWLTLNREPAWLPETQGCLSLEVG
jgi:hypothetical protein